MSETKFSKGPWRVAWPVPKADLCQKIITADGSAIMGNETYYPWCPEKGHDWVLIAAAPEMYEMLNAIAPGGSVATYEIYALLAKARGES